MQNLSIIGLGTHELTSIKQLVNLLRHPDPTVGLLAHAALDHVQEMAATSLYDFSRTIPHAISKNLV